MVSHFYRTEYEIWASFGPNGRTGNFGLGQFLGFHGQEKLNFSKEILVSTLKSCIKKQKVLL